MNVKIVSILLVSVCFILSAGVRGAVRYTNSDLPSSEEDQKSMADIGLPSQKVMSEMKTDNLTSVCVLCKPRIPKPPVLHPIKTRRRLEDSMHNKTRILKGSPQNAAEQRKSQS